MIRRLTILLLIVGCVFAQNSNLDSTFYFYNEFGDNSIDTTLLNVNEFHTIYYKDGSIAIHDSLVSGCHITFGGSGLAKFGVSQKGLAKGTISIIECATYSDGNLENIVDLEKVDRIEKKDGEIVSGVQMMKKFRNFKIIIRSIFGGIIISLILFV